MTFIKTKCTGESIADRFHEAKIFMYQVCGGAGCCGGVEMYAMQGETCFSVMNGRPCATLQTVLLNMLLWAPTEFVRGRGEVFVGVRGCTICFSFRWSL